MALKKLIKLIYRYLRATIVPRSPIFYPRYNDVDGILLMSMALLHHKYAYIN